MGVNWIDWTEEDFKRFEACEVSISAELLSSLIDMADMFIDGWRRPKDTGRLKRQLAAARQLLDAALDET